MIEIAEDVAPKVTRITHDMGEDAAMSRAVNAVIAAASGQWIYYCYNGEYLFFPFCENRTVGEMLAFSMEERRESLMTYVVDIYAGNLGRHPNAISLDDAYLDKLGYYALTRHIERDRFHKRQLDFFGGLRCRFEEHVPYLRRRIDWIAPFRTKPGLLINEDHLLNDHEMNT